MDIEYEATFLNIDKDEIRNKLKNIGASLIREEYKQKRYNFDLQSLGRDFYEWVRVRDEGDKITMAYKNIPKGATINEQREIEFEIGDFERAISFMEVLGAKKKNYSETFREIWKLNDVEIMIDTWPYLEPYLEIEASSEDSVKKVAERLGFKWDDAIFSGAGWIYEMKYGIHPDKLNENKCIRLTFDDPNPFL